MHSSGTVYDPQSWNRYTYTLNNPLRYTDPTGMYTWSNALGGSKTDEDLLKDAGKDKKKIEAANKIIEQRNKFRCALVGAESSANNPELTAAQQQEIRDSVAAYGTENDGNNVVVGFGKNRGGRTELLANGTIEVMFNKDSAKGDNFIISTAHEGKHVADFQAWLASPKAGGPTDLTDHALESRAYMVSSYVAQSLGKSPHPGIVSDQPKYHIWNSGWKEAERAEKRAKGVERFVERYYGTTTAQPGKKISEYPRRQP